MKGTRLPVKLSRTLALFLFAATLAGQGPAPVRSPEVHPDRTVTFRLRAPQAAQVELSGEVLQGKPPQAMTKSSDGVWSITIRTAAGGNLDLQLPDRGHRSARSFKYQPDAARGRLRFRIELCRSPWRSTGILRCAARAPRRYSYDPLQVEGDECRSLFLDLPASRL